MAVRGIRTSSRLQIILALVEYAILAVLTVAAFIFVFILKGDGSVRPSLSWLNPTGTGGAGVVSAGILISIFFIAGWDAAIYLNEETEAPEKNPGKAAIVSVAVLGAFYFLMIICLQGVVSQERLSEHSENAAPYIAGVVLGPVGSKIVAIAVLMSVLATTQAFIVATARIAFSMGRDQVLPGVFGRINPSTQTPAVGTLIVGATGVILGFAYVYAGTVATAIDSMIAVIGLLFAAFYAITGFACVWHHRRTLGRSAKDLLLGGALPCLGAVIMSWVTYESYADLDGKGRAAIAAVVATGLVAMMIAARITRAPLFRERVRTPTAPPSS